MEKQQNLECKEQSYKKMREEIKYIKNYETCCILINLKVFCADEFGGMVQYLGLLLVEVLETGPTVF